MPRPTAGTRIRSSQLRHTHQRQTDQLQRTNATPPAHAGVDLTVVRDYTRYHSDDATRTALASQTHMDRGKVLLTCLRLWLTLENCSYGCGLIAMRCASSSGYVVGRVLQVRGAVGWVKVMSIMRACCVP